MMARMMAMAIAAAMILFAAHAARADSCETFPGSQVYTDQGCDKPYENKPAPKQAAPKPPPQNNDSLRDRLRRELDKAAAAKPSLEELNKRVVDARKKVDAALADPNAPGAKQRYDAAMKDLHSAYADSVKAYPDKADALQRQENQDAAHAGSLAAAAGWDAPVVPAAAVDATPSKPAGPDNVTAVGDKVYVCDGAIAGANNVSCREISADGGQCTGVTLADGGMGWRDSIATPCHSGDMEQRNAFLAANPDAAAAGRAAPPGFSMSSDATNAEIRRLVDEAEKNEWNEAMADPAGPTVDDASAVAPIDLASFNNSNNSGGGFDLNDAINILGVASQILGTAAAISTPSYSAPAPSYRAPPSAQRSAPPVQYHPPAPVQGCVGVYVCSAK